MLSLTSTYLTQFRHPPTEIYDFTNDQSVMLFLYIMVHALCPKK